MTGLPFATGTRDERQNGARRQQIEGCRYAASDGQLDYLVWKLSAKGTADDVAQALPSKQNGAQTFAPRIGTAAAGAAMTVGGSTTVQVNATKGTRLVQVTVAETSGSRARAAALAVAKTLLNT